MARLEMMVENDLWILVDGFMRDRSQYNHKKFANIDSMEDIMARHLYSLVNRQMTRPHPIDIWVIGENGWLEYAPELLKKISENETNDSYRIIVSRSGLTEVRRPYLHSWDKWPFLAGLVRQKGHINRKHFQIAGRTFLNCIQSRQNELGIPYSEVLQYFDIPFKYYGGSCPSLEEPSSHLIQ